MNDDMNFEDMNYGVAVIDKRDLEKNKDGNVNILHFFGYWNKPSQQDVCQLRKELTTEPEYGLMDMAEHIGIYLAPYFIVEEYRNEIIKENTANLNKGDSDSEFQQKYE